MPIELCDMSARALSSLLRSRAVSAVEVMEAHLARIATWNPRVNALVGMRSPEACLALARDADARALRGEPTGPLHGLPFAFKDLQEAAGLPFTRGSRIFQRAVGVTDSLLVERIRSAGAIPIGKTNVPEFGLGSHTFNPVWGVTRNPYDLSKSAGGSSGGAGAALATGMLPLADGSDLGGSLRNPANFNNVVALRPSVGLVPTAPDPFPRMGFGVNGPMGRSADDVAFLLGVMAGADPRDGGCEPSDPQTLGASLSGDLGPRPPRVAFCPDLGGLPLDASVRTVIAAQRRTLESIGCEVVDICPDLVSADAIFLAFRRWRSAAIFGPLLSEHRSMMKRELIEEIEAGARLTGRDIASALAAHTDLLRRMAEFFERVDVLACAVNQVPPFDADIEWPASVAGVPMEHYVAWMKSTYWITATFAPAASVPAGFTEGGLPVGLQLVGRPREDRRLLELCHRFEMENRTGRVRPSPAPPS